MKMATEDKIKFMDCLGEYIQECEEELKLIKNTETKRDLALSVMCSNHIKVCKEILEVLSFSF